MEFCQKCNNMYYMKTNDENELMYYCKFCGDENKELIHEKNLKVYKYTNETRAKDVQINEYTKYDVTLPHTSNIKCPNMECKSNKEDKLTQDIITIRVDDTNMKYLYLCSHCNYNWTP